MARGGVRALIAVVAGLVAGLVVAAPVAAGPIDRKLDRALNKIVNANQGAPGVSVLMRKAASGPSSPAGRRTPIRPATTVDDHMRIASVAKAFNGAVAFALVDAGCSRSTTRSASGCPACSPSATR